MFRLHNRDPIIQTKLILHFQRRGKRVLRLVDQIFYFTYRCCHVIKG
ncbi:hypothetical protein Gogos_012954 [Gossypium gossypioides]|uniref:Uncharacterized protein n=1 Tax=Gossypium gossypioides TaxID=34282 RepID=A0A7J9BU75_GOSGO|nr:hypothetical protein [Gossypium gossypioides]MBA0739716.1 hypothetical protein [Gossypium gossypioides]